MPLPKRRHTRSRRNKRRSHWKLSAPSVVACPNCHHPRVPHRVCPNCGYYRGRSVFIPKEG